MRSRCRQTTFIAFFDAQPWHPPVSGQQWWPNHCPFAPDCQPASTNLLLIYPIASLCFLLSVCVSSCHKLSSSLLGIPPPTGLQFPPQCFSYLLASHTIMSRHRAVWIMRGNWSLLPTTNLLSHDPWAICSGLNFGRNWSDFLLKQRGVHYSTGRFTNWSVFLPFDSSASKRQREPSGTYNWPWAKMVLHTVRICDNVPASVAAGSSLKSHECSCAGEDTVLDTDCKRNEVKNSSTSIIFFFSRSQCVQDPWKSLLTTAAFLIPPQGFPL